MGILSKVLSTGSKRPVKKYMKEVTAINDLEAEYKKMSDDELKARHDKLRDQARGDSPDDKYLRDNAFALLRERIRRRSGKRAYDVQLCAGLALWDGNIIEASTGSGKTIVSHFPTYLSALYGRQCHVVTVNEYLTERDADEARDFMGGLGVTVGRIYNQQPNGEKKEAYKADVVYGTPSEFGFDYLRDNMVPTMDSKVQCKGHPYAIIDEVDSILIDEARTPLIISGAGTSSSETYQKFARAVVGLERDVDYKIEEDKKQIATTETGLAKVEDRLGISIFDDLTGRMANHLLQALKAEYLFKRDKDYIVTGKGANGEVKIVDENTGRIMEGRRWSEGLHQAIEAKEHVTVQEENRTMATITLQNYFRLYDKLSGMTGTALTEASEFREIYHVETLGIPDNKRCVRKDLPDVIYMTEQAKYEAIADEIEEAHAKGQPVLAGTISVENSEKLSRLLDRRGIEHSVLNAKQHAKEAEIVAEAGRYGAVTIATNMAGRGTDIMLGGNVDGMAKILARQLMEQRVADEGRELTDEDEPTSDEFAKGIEKAQAIFKDERQKVIDAGGLYVIGSERHDARRIDNQLRGRSGRQGDPGKSQFFISLQDDLLRLFGTETMERITDMLRRSEWPEDEPIRMKMAGKAIESAQHKVEKLNFESRKRVLEYDDVINRQRKVVYGERDNVLAGEDIYAKVPDMVDDAVKEAVERYATSGNSKKWDWKGLEGWYSDLTGKDGDDLDEGADRDKEKAKDFSEHVTKTIMAQYDGKKKLLKNVSNTDEAFAAMQRMVMLSVIDSHWQDHLSAMDYLRAGIGLRGFGQRDPLVEYKQDAFRAFQELIDSMYGNYLKQMLRISIQYNDVPRPTSQLRYSQPMEPAGSATRSASKAKNYGIGDADIIKARQTLGIGDGEGEQPFMNRQMRRRAASAKARKTKSA